MAQGLSGKQRAALPGTSQPVGSLFRVTVMAQPPYHPDMQNAVIQRITCRLVPRSGWGLLSALTFYGEADNEEDPAAVAGASGSQQSRHP